MPRFRFIAGFQGAEAGSAAVAFTLVGLPFFLLLCAIFEAALVLLAQQSLDNGLDRAARQVFTGAFQEGYDATPSAERLRKAMCPGLVYVDCTRVLLEVTTAATFSARSVTEPYNAATRSIASGFGSRFQCPAGNDVVTVRAAATVPRFFALPGLLPRPLAPGGQLVVSTAIFRAEPYAAGRC